MKGLSLWNGNSWSRSVRLQHNDHSGCNPLKSLPDPPAPLGRGSWGLSVHVAEPVWLNGTSLHNRHVHWLWIDLRQPDSWEWMTAG